MLTTLFDKSFLQSLSVDESVWFDRHFMPVVCPVFYAETLADLAKEPTKSGPAEKQVRDIAAKFPEISGYPCASHLNLVVADLLGSGPPVSMDGRVPIHGGRFMRAGDQRGIVFDQSPESIAFIRWQQGEFLTVERQYASGFRHALASLDLRASKEAFRLFELDRKAFVSLEDVRAAAERTVDGSTQRFEQLRLAVGLFDVPGQLHQPISERWHRLGCPPLPEFAPYASYAVTVEVFFHLAMATDFISTERPSNRMDIAYLFYLPFSQVFVSGDKLHQKCAPLFMRENQEFVWGLDLKADLKKINAHYLALPEFVRDRGIMDFAHLPPKNGDFLTARIYDRFGEHWRDEPEIRLNDRDTKKALADKLRAFIDSKEPLLDPPADPEDPSLNTRSLERQVHKRKGSWWQLPKHLPDNPPDRP